MRTSLVPVGALASTACGGLTSDPAVNPDAALLLDFQTRIDRYIELREEALELPRGLEYRIIGTDLILLDQPANLIIDFMRNVIRATPA
jgi:hypothetical protein